MEGFVWTFPCYILAATPVGDTDAGDVAIDSNLQFIAPEIGPPGGEQGIAIFTDAHLAEEYRDQTDSKLNLSLLEFATPSQLKAFLERAQDQYRHVVVDLTQRISNATLAIRQTGSSHIQPQHSRNLPYFMSRARI